jgi:hypothetical protein
VSQIKMPRRQPTADEGQWTAGVPLSRGIVGSEIKFAPTFRNLNNDTRARIHWRNAKGGSYLQVRQNKNLKTCKIPPRERITSVMCAPEKTYKENEHPGVGDTVAAARAMRHESTRRFKAWQRIPSVRSEPQRLNGGPPKGNRMVFVVDDQPDVAEFAKTVLDHAGFPTAVFLDGIIAWHPLPTSNRACW